MIAFATLLLGIVYGAETLQFTVGDDVAEVVLMLDGEEITRLRAAPWRARVDLGPRPRPRHLEAIAFDGEGQELGRAVQWINLPRPAAETSVVVEPNPDGGAVAHLSWESLAGAEPIRVEASFDGRPLDAGDPRAIRLPAFDDGALHFFRVELFFNETVSAVIERTLGGTYTDTVVTELTAIPIRVEKGKKKVVKDQLVGRLSAGPKTLRPVAVEKGSALVVMVVDRDVYPQLEAMIGRRMSRQQRAFARRWLALDPGDHLRFLWTVPQRHAGAARTYDLFNLSETFDANADGVFVLMRDAPRPRYTAQGSQRIADAVANAGIEAGSRRRARAVVLVVSGDVEDRSALRPEQVRPYLEDIQVPFEVWSLEAKPEPGPWGEARSISQPLRLEKAVKDLLARLRRQRIVWVEGTHLPQQVEIAPADDLVLELVR